MTLGCPACAGITVQLALELLSSFGWNHRPACAGIRTNCSEFTVKEALLHLPHLKLSEQTAEFEHKFGVLMSCTLESELRMMGVQLAPPRERLMDALLAREAEGFAVTEDEFRKAMHAGSFDLPMMWVVGVTAQPIGYAFYLNTKVSNPVYRAAHKPIRRYFDVVPARWGLPLYHDQFKHLIDMAEVVERHRPWEAEKERRRAERRVMKAAVAQLVEDAPSAAVAKAFHLILNASLPSSCLSIREAIRMAQHFPHDETAANVEERMRAHRQRFGCETQLYNAGIRVEADGAPGGEVVDPEKLLKLRELRVLEGMEEQLLGLWLPV